MIPGQAKRDLGAEGYGEGVWTVARHENSPTLFTHCRGPGYGHGFVKPAFQAGAVCRSDQNGKVICMSYGSSLSRFSVVGEYARRSTARCGSIRRCHRVKIVSITNWHASEICHAG